MTWADTAVRLAREVLDVSGVTDSSRPTETPAGETTAATESGRATAAGAAIAPAVMATSEGPTISAEYDVDVIDAEPQVGRFARLVIRMHEKAETIFFEHESDEGVTLFDLEMLSARQDDNWWLPFAGEQRILEIPAGQASANAGPGPVSPPLRIGEEIRGVIFLGFEGGLVYYKVPGIRYRVGCWGLNRCVRPLEFVMAVLGYQPLNLIDFAGFYEGAILGDLIEEPTVAQLAGQIVVGFIPIVGQLADARDTLVAIHTVWETRGASGKLNLGACLIGWAPTGDLLKKLPRIGSMIKDGDKVTAVVRRSDNTPEVLVRRGTDVLLVAEQTRPIAQQVTELAIRKADDVSRLVFVDTFLNDLVKRAIRELLDEGFRPINRAHLGTVLGARVSRFLRAIGVEPVSRARLLVETAFKTLPDFPASLANQTLESYIRANLHPDYFSIFSSMFNRFKTKLGNPKLVGNLRSDLRVDFEAEFLVWDLTFNETRHVLKTLLYTSVQHQANRRNGKGRIYRVLEIHWEEFASEVEEWAHVFDE